MHDRSTGALLPVKLECIFGSYFSTQLSSLSSLERLVPSFVGPIPIVCVSLVLHQLLLSRHHFLWSEMPMKRFLCLTGAGQVC